MQVMSIAEAVSKSDVAFLLLPDEVLPRMFEAQIVAHLGEGSTLVFASGYTVAFGEIQLPSNSDVLLIAPRMIGVGVRERFLSGEGFFCFVGIHQDVSGNAKERLLALTKGIGGLIKPAIQVSFKEEAVLDLFNEQAFGPAFGRVLLSAISVLLDQGYPPAAVLVEMYLSEEMAYTYRKMASVGLVQQTLYHSQTSQYGAMSKGIRFLNLGLRQKMDRIHSEIVEGVFAKEWRSPIAQLKLKVIRYFAMRQRINRVEQRVRALLGMKELPATELESEALKLKDHPELGEVWEAFERGYEY